MARSGLVPVIVDTSLDTHLTIAVSPRDTVASVKRKLVSEHGLCFPEVGRIDIDALITLWQGKEYRLAETMSISVVLQMDGGCFLKALVGTQLRSHTEINTSLKKKRKRNIASFQDTTTLRPTQSRKGGGEEFQGHGENRPSNDSYCDAKKGESRKAGTNDAVCEDEYIIEALLSLGKEKYIFKKKSRHDSESPEIPEGPTEKKAKMIISEKTDERIIVVGTINDGENMGKRRHQVKRKKGGEGHTGNLSPSPGPIATKLRRRLYGI